MARMTQAEIIRAIARDTGLKNAQVTMLLDALKALAIAEVRTAGEFVVPGFGRLVKAARKAREGRNPATGEVITILAQNVVKFRIVRSLAAAVSDDLLPDRVSEPIEETAEDPSAYPPDPQEPAPPEEPEAAEEPTGAEEYSWPPPAGWVEPGYSPDPPGGGNGPEDSAYAELPGEWTKEGDPG